MMICTIQCPQCGAHVPDIEGPTHAYYGEAPGCWALFGAVLARELGDYRFARLHRLTADAYAAQHPGSADDRRAVQSVAVHLIGLCLVLEPAASLAPGQDLAPLLQAAADRSDRFRWLEPPADLGALTVVDVHGAVPSDSEALGDDHAAAHLTMVQRWADSVWSAWRIHHEQVRRWTASLLEDRAVTPSHRRHR